VSGGAAAEANPADRERVVRTVVHAFAADPAFRYFFPDDATYEEHAAAFAGWLFDRRVGHGTVWVADGGAGVAMWEPPHLAGSADGDAPDLVLPDAVRQRLDGYEHAVHRVLPAQPYWYLGVLATAPEHGGRGLGRAVMRAGLDRAGADSLPSVLETTNPANLGLYEHLGWQVHASTTVDAMTVWVLAHPA
jgi:ribosomal protein S18 acetylase RimI-like enzyme